jgi:chemotaxis family two-component system sensor kinase Cph1
MKDITDFFKYFFNAENWPARWSCGKWSGFHGWLYILSDIAIWGAYFAIPIIIIIFIKNRKEKLPFKKVFWAFILFILACGTTHFVDAIMFWYPAYRLSAFLLLGTAIISWGTVYILIKILPEALNLKSAAQLEEIIEIRTTELKDSHKHQMKLNENLDHFVYSASHDLKSPINNIEGLILLLKEEIVNYDNPKSKKIVEKIDHSLLKVKSSIHSLTEILKVQREPYDDKEQLNFHDLLEEILIENEELIRVSKSQIIQDFNIETIYYSKRGMKSILYNLITNAVKYRSDKRIPIVKISTFTNNSKIILTVSDNGLGIDLEKHKIKLFSIFKRLHDHVEGSGIGLYIIKRIIEDAGGMIDVSSEIDKGTEFKIIF